MYRHIYHTQSVSALSFNTRVYALSWLSTRYCQLDGGRPAERRRFVAELTVAPSTQVDRSPWVDRPGTYPNIFAPDGWRTDLSPDSYPHGISEQECIRLGSMFWWRSDEICFFREGTLLYQISSQFSMTSWIDCGSLMSRRMEHPEMELLEGFL